MVILSYRLTSEHLELGAANELEDIIFVLGKRGLCYLTHHNLFEFHSFISKFHDFVLL